MKHRVEDTTQALSVHRRVAVQDIEDTLRRRYAVRGYAKNLLTNDLGLLRRLDVHPADATVGDMERVILRASRTSTRQNYIRRFRSVFMALEEEGVLVNHEYKKLPKLRPPRALPRPATDREVRLLLEKSQGMVRDWFILAAYAGLRCCEIARVKGSDLEEAADGWLLYVEGKGGTRLSIPAHPLVVEVFQRHATLGRFWRVGASHVSHVGGNHMKRLGVNKSMHTLRHWFATTALRASGDLMAVSSLLRHAHLSTSARYIAVADDKPRAAILVLPDMTASAA